MKLYTTNEVAAATGATLRQLQWWDECGHIKAERGRVGGRVNGRLYSLDQLKQIQRIMDIRREFKLHFKDIPMHGRVRVITGPTQIGGVLIIPKRRNWRA